VQACARVVDIGVGGEPEVAKNRNSGNAKFQTNSKRYDTEAATELSANNAKKANEESSSKGNSKQ
jgi:hypothetical protein